MNPVAKCNLATLSWWALYAAAAALSLLSLPAPLKLAVLVALAAVRTVRLILVVVISYLLLVCGFGGVAAPLSTYIFKVHFNTRHNLEVLRGGGPYMIVMNYPVPFYNYFTYSILPENTVYAGGDSAFYGVHMLSNKFYRLARRGNFGRFQRFVKRAHSAGLNVAVFAEEIHTPGDKPNLHRVGRVKSGVFTIAKNLGIPVVPVAIGVVRDEMGIPSSHDHYARAGDPFIVRDVDLCVRRTREFFLKHTRRSMVRQL